MPCDRFDAAVRLLRDAGCDACAIGTSALQLLAGQQPRLLRISTDASPALLLSLFPRAAVIGDAPFALALGGVSAPLQIFSRPAQRSLESVLREALFGIEALAVALPSREPIDPLHALRDWREGRLRAVAPASRIAGDPLAALRAARLCAEHALEPDADLHAALRATPLRLDAASPAELRSEITRLLLAPRVARGLTLLREFGVEQLLVPGARGDAPEVVAALPAERTLRLLGWLRGSVAGRAMRRLQVPPAQAVRLERVLRFHPIDLSGAVLPSAALRLLRRLGDQAIDWLLALREAELGADPGAAPEAHARLSQARDAIEAARRPRDAARTALALGGRDVIAELGCAPGPAVGRALRFLAERVEAQPELNRRDALLALLHEWDATAAEGRALGSAAGDPGGRIEES